MSSRVQPNAIAEAGSLPGEEAARLAALFERLPALAEADADLVRRGAHLDVRLQVGIGDVPFDVTVARGHVVALERGPLMMRPWRFAVWGTPEAWRRHWEPVPEPGWHDLFALTKRGAARIEGDLQPLLANLQYVKDLLALPRRIAKGNLP